jgi:polar amino acid transport system substrate-binding protein
VTDSVIVPAGATTPATAAAATALTLGAVPGVEAAALTGSGGAAPKPLADESAAMAALASKAVQGVVMPTPAAIALAADDPAVVVAGQLPSDPASQPDQFKALLPKGSALTGCVSAVIDRLRVEGELESFATTWVDPSAPRLR